MFGEVEKLCDFAAVENKKIVAEFLYRISLIELSLPRTKAKKLKTEL